MAIQIDGWSVSPRYRKCKKTDCEVCANGKGHGPYYIGTRREKGKTISRYFGTTPPNQDDVQMTYTSDVQNDVYTIDEEQTAQIEALMKQNEQLQAELDQLRPRAARLQADYDQQTAQIEALKRQNGQLQANLDEFIPLAKKLLADCEKQSVQIKKQLRQIETLNAEVERLRTTANSQPKPKTNTIMPTYQGQYRDNDLDQALSKSIKAIEARIAKTHKSPSQGP